jgi:hypothetical protein
VADMALTKEVLELIDKAASRLKQHLLLELLVLITSIIGAIAVVTIVVVQIIIAKHIDISPLLVFVGLLSAMGFTATVLYYDASKKLAVWQGTFRSYKTVALVLMLLAIIIMPVSIYTMSIAMGTINDIVNRALRAGESTSKPEVLVELLAELSPHVELLSLFSALSSLVGNVISIYLVGIFRCVKDSFTAEVVGLGEQPSSTAPELLKLEDATKFLRIALILLLVGQGLSYIGLGIVNSLLGIAGLVLWFLGLARAWGGLNGIKRAIPHVLLILETKTRQQS